ncbi:hypothetical protein VNO77_43987 [Canavalia gladiata]|uniref:Uncharacterized protein n=1 Tax=Canavalia gladiata TaxID=3824 RepID=A0AAN9JW00_CANGL
MVPTIESIELDGVRRSTDLSRAIERCTCDGSQLGRFGVLILRKSHLQLSEISASSPIEKKPKYFQYVEFYCVAPGNG